ncbi:N-glycosylase/DNA lyase-like isoform X1 [Lineus longissimus]|uniref:N-glycosylase/DNA lyase-like isoform X1 n=1 Tax=Lineus longissimus TaxID=88925 RepID=UPI002B4F9B7B
MASWWRLPCKTSDIRLDILLACGQSFRWREISPAVWRGVLVGRVWTLRQTDEEILYQVKGPTNAVRFENGSVAVPREPLPIKSKRGKELKQKNEDSKSTDKVIVKQESSLIMKAEKDENVDDASSVLNNSILRDYFQLDVDLKALYSQWSAADKNFQQVASDFPGVRMLRQDPVENLFSFICSSNNHISRISGMVEKLCQNYGEEVAELDGVSYYSFPNILTLSGDGIEQELRNLGFGYRAKFISKSAKYICENKDDGWLNSLRLEPYEVAKRELMNLCGVGAKVADCVCLMSLDKTGAIPVDTHVWQIAMREYMPKLSKAKSLTDTIYKEIGDFFRDLWGDYAGWAHSVLFSADLKKFQDLKTPPKIKRTIKVKDELVKTKKAKKR